MYKTRGFYLFLTRLRERANIVVDHRRLDSLVRLHLALVVLKVDLAHVPALAFDLLETPGLGSAPVLAAVLGPAPALAEDDAAFVRVALLQPTLADVTLIGVLGLQIILGNAAGLAADGAEDLVLDRSANLAVQNPVLGRGLDASRIIAQRSADVLHADARGIERGATLLAEAIRQDIPLLRSLGAADARKLK